MSGSSFSHSFVATFPFSFASNAKKVLHSFLKQACFEKWDAGFHVLGALFAPCIQKYTV